jgi:predicted NUDIX family NTP pyrophosphohydrolase
LPESAGILLFRHGDGEVELLLAHPGGPFWQGRHSGAWTLPKGEPEAGEDLRECALRELREELGPAAAVEAAELLDLGSVRQKGGKVVHAFAAESDFDPASIESSVFEIEWPPRSGARREFPEVDRVEWFRPARAREMLNPAQVELVDRLLDRLGLVERADGELGSEDDRG